jgi:hypothetical protein
MAICSDNHQVLLHVAIDLRYVNNRMGRELTGCPTIALRSGNVVPTVEDSGIFVVTVMLVGSFSVCFRN